MQITRLLLRRRCALKLRECPQLLQQNRNLINISRKISMTTKQLIETAGRNSISWVNFSVSRYCTPSVKEQELIDISTFEKICDETLDSLTEYFEELVEKAAHLEAADVSYGSGVLTVTFGHPYGTYVINRQTPNRQIWLSSPVSGPKRYDFVDAQRCWIYKHDGNSLHELLQTEIPRIIKADTDFSRCAYSRLKK